MLQEVRQLTGKQKAFVKEYVKTKNGLQSALKAYETTDPNVAKVIASDNLTKPNIRRTIDEYLELAEYNPIDSIRSLRSNEIAGQGVKATASDSIRASELLLKLSGAVIDRSQSTSLNINVESLDKNELLKVKKKYDALLNLDK